MGILVAILAFAIMVFIHEFGHFITAKLFNIKVLEFAVGMGPAIFKKKKGETLYSVRCLPLGGYCSMEGEDAKSDDARSFSNAAWWKRIIVVSAGAILNVLLGFIFLIVVQSSFKTVNLPVINKLEEKAYMDEAGFQAGDRIVSLNKSRVNVYEDIYFFLERMGENEVEVSVERDGQIVKNKVKPVEEKRVYNFYKDRTDVKIYVNGEFSDEFQAEASSDENLFDKTYEEKRYILGFECLNKENSFTDVLKRSFYMTAFYVKTVYMSVYEIITGRIPVNQLSGPVGVVDVIGKASAQDIFFLFEILALITINLGVMNLLPIPALDGCKILVILIEIITRKKIPPEKEGIINLIGFAFLILIMLFATYNDIIRLINGG